MRCLSCTWNEKKPRAGGKQKWDEKNRTGENKRWGERGGRQETKKKWVEKIGGQWRKREGDRWAEKRQQPDDKLITLLSDRQAPLTHVTTRPHLTWPDGHCYQCSRYRESALAASHAVLASHVVGHPGRESWRAAVPWHEGIVQWPENRVLGTTQHRSWQPAMNRERASGKQNSLCQSCWGEPRYELHNQYRIIDMDP